MTAQAAAILGSGNARAARDMLLQAVALGDDVAERWQLLGRAQLELGNMPEAYVAYSRSLELETANAEALLTVAELAFQLGDTRRADTVAERVLLLSPGAKRALTVRALVALDERRLPDALRLAEEILSGNKGDEYGVIIKARTLAIKGDLTGAASLIEGGIAPEAQTDATYFTLAELYKLQGNFAGLTRANEALVEARKTDPGIKLEYARILYKGGDAAKARAQLRAILFDKSFDEASADALFRLWQDFDPEPLDQADIGKIVSGGTVLQRIAVARWQLAAVRPQLALQTITGGEGRQQFGDTETALLATARLALGQKKEAGEIAAKVLERDPSNVDALMVNADLASQKKDFRAAARDAQLAVAEAPYVEESHVMLAKVLAASGDGLRARQTYEQALQKLPQRYSLLAAYVRFLESAGDGTRKVSVVRDYTRANPSDTRGWALLLATCRALGDACVTEAVAGMKRAQGVFTLDERPGARRRRGLFARL